MNTRALTLAMAAATALLCGCSGVSLPTSLDALTPGGGGNPGMKKIGTLPPPPTRTWPDATLDVNANRADGFGLVAMPEMEQYLNGLLGKIKATAGVPAWPGAVYVTADTSLKAYSSAAGNIYVSVYWIQVAESEDEIHALLAHEFGHIYLNHHVIHDVKTAGETTAAVTSLAWSYANKRAAATSWTGVDNIFVIQTLGTRALFPAWQRSVEEEADRFGVTISLKAGYSYPDGFKAFLERIGTYDEQAKARQQKLKALQTAAAREKVQQNAGRQPLVPATPAKTSVSTLSTSANLGGLRDAINVAAATQPGIKTSIDTTTFDVQHALEDQVGEAAESLQETHGDATQREAALRKQVEPLVGDNTPDARTAPWQQARKRGANPVILSHYAMAGEIQALQAGQRLREAAAAAETMASGPTANDGMPVYTLANLNTVSTASAQDSAIRTLRRNLSAREPSWRVQVNLASRMASKDPGEAERFLQKQFDAFGRPANTWPDMIAFYRDHGSPQRAREMAVTCAGAYPAYRAPCQAAAETPAEARANNKSIGDWMRDALNKATK